VIIQRVREARKEKKSAEASAGAAVARFAQT